MYTKISKQKHYNNRGGDKNMQHVQQKQAGFTLVEILIVVILLAIIAGVVIPQFTGSTEDAKLSTLKSNLGTLRNAVELYYHSHKETYPGDVTSNYGGHSTNAEFFVDQLTLYTDEDGEAVSVKDATHKFGPYLKKGVPVNPFDNDATVVIDDTEDDLAVAAPDGSGGWMFFTQTGQLFANDGAHDTL